MSSEIWPASALEAAERTFRALVSRPSPLALDCRGLHPQLPSRHLPLDELRKRLLDRAVAPQARDAAWSLLVGHAQTGGPAWVIGAVAMARPALVAIAQGLARGFSGDSADIDSAVLEGFLTALRCADPATDRLPMPLLRAARRAGIRARHWEAEHQRISRPLDAGAVMPPPPYGHEDLILGRAVATGVLTREQAELISVTRLDKVPSQIAARQRGLSLDMLRMRRLRAETKLVRAIQDGRLTTRA
ncbi:hypothetical protein HDA40_002166 [Hamadaea flava]|uniref:DNA-directed RNA polymerase specialized sigma24 family protein n=1 Tax=Hamadaea flava TaxID=1742688 RepID=A0ABV8LJR8_9ACTN|nr:hypothetical protein [Hamadaea flava]MCP2323659.1 hypothetical protein [Hamadaea flava]